VAMRMGAAGHQRVLDHFTAEHLVSGTLEQYAIVLANRRKRALIRRKAAFHR
jgi:hypothetical protein